MTNEEMQLLFATRKPLPSYICTHCAWQSAWSTQPGNYPAKAAGTGLQVLPDELFNLLDGRGGPEFSWYDTEKEAMAALERAYQRWLDPAWMDDAERRAREVIRVGPDLTGFAQPKWFWVYLGDHVIVALNSTEEEAERIARPYRRTIAEAIRKAVEESGGKS